MRIDKFISNNTRHSRSEAHRLIKEGRVTVNGSAVRDVGMKIATDPAAIAIAIDGEALQAVGDMYYMLHKPPGYVCANTDGTYPTVLDLLGDARRSRGGAPPRAAGVLGKLQVAGRLDLDTTGLVLLTSDGQWNHRLTSPRSHCFKCYQVHLDAAPPADTQRLFAAGIHLEGEPKKTQPAQLEVISPQHVKLSIREGKYHQVKRMFAAVGCRVLALHRESIGQIRLDKKLLAGDYRQLHPWEIHSVASHSTPSEEVY